MFSKRTKNQKGFTLVELIVVIAILGILAGIAVPRLTGFQERAAVKADEANAKTVANTLAILLADNKFVGQTNGGTAGTVPISGPVTATEAAPIRETFTNSTVPTTQAQVHTPDSVLYYEVNLSSGAITVKAKDATGVTLFPK